MNKTNIKTIFEKTSEDVTNKKKNSSTIALPPSKWDNSSKITNEECISNEKCPICLSQIENKSVTNSCFHEFCFQCLKEWAKVKSVCPLCKSTFQYIIHNIRSDTDYDEYQVASQPSQPILSSVENSNRPIGNNVTRHFDAEGWRENSERHENFRAAMIACTDVNIIHQRRMFYRNGTFAQTSKNKKCRKRSISSTFFLQNPAQKHRLVPWLKRELIILYGAKKLLLINRICELLLSAISHIELDSDEFRDEFQPYFVDATEQFLHEFTSFAKSPYDISEYDQHTKYKYKKARNTMLNLSAETVLSPPLFRQANSNEFVTRLNIGSTLNQSLREHTKRKKTMQKKYCKTRVKHILPTETYVISSSESCDDIKFVKVIKRPGLKKPDEIVNLISSSSDNSTPGPSTSSGMTSLASVPLYSNNNLSDSCLSSD